MKVNSSENKSHLEVKVNYFDVMEIVQLSVAPVGIIGNLMVIVVFLNHTKLRRKIPNRFIVNQVRKFLFFSLCRGPSGHSRQQRNKNITSNYRQIWPSS